MASQSVNIRYFVNRVLLPAAILAMTSLQALAQPTFSKLFAPDIIGPGSVATLTFTIDNLGSGTPVTMLAFSDTLPAGVTIADPANSSSNCIGGTLSAPDGGGTISYSDGGIGAFSSCQISVDVTSSTAAVHMNVSGDLTSSAGNSGTATDDLTVTTARPGFSKSFSPSSISLGSRATLTFTVDNSANASGIFNPAFTDILPPGMTVADPANISSDCGTVTAVGGSDTIVLSNIGATAVAAGATCTVSADVTGTGVGMHDNISGELTSIIGISSLPSGKASDTLEVTRSDLALEKAFTDDPVNPGGTVTLEFTITNFDRDFAATGITFSDDLDLTLVGLVATGLPLANPCGAGSSLSGASLITLTGGTLPAQGSCTFSVTLQTPAMAIAGAYPNTTSSISGDVNGMMVTGDPASETLFINEAPSITKTFLTDPVGAGDTVSVEFTITNTSPSSAATDITFTDNLAQFLSGTTVSALPAAGFCGAGSFLTTFLNLGELNLLMSGGSLAAGGSCTFTVDLDIPVGAPQGIATNSTSPVSATVDGATQTGQPTSADLTIVSAPTITKSFTDDPVLPGGAVTLEFTISHDALAPADATAIAFTDDLAGTLTGLAATGLPMTDICGMGSSISGTTNLSFTGGTLTPGSSCTFSVTLQVPAAAIPGTYGNSTSSLMATVSGTAAIGNPAADDLLVSGLSISKSFTDDPVLPGGLVTLEFTIDNSNSTVDATGMFFTDSLSTTLSGMAAVAPLPATPCGAGSVISGTSFLIFTGGNLLAGESCTFSVTVQVPGGAADGVYSNTTSSLTATLGGSVAILDPATDSLTVDSDILVLNKSFTDDPVEPGDMVTLEFTIENLNTTETVTDIAFTDDLDAALSGLVATGLPMSNICGAGSLINGTGTLTFTSGMLAAGASCTFSVTLTVPAGAALGSVATNTTSTISGMAGGVGVSGGAASDDLQINFLSFSKAFDGPSTASGTAILSFTIENLSATTPVSGIGFTDDLDSVITGLVATGLPATDVCGSGSSISGTSILTLSGGNLLPGGSCTIPVTVQLPAGAMAGTYPNTTSDLFLSGLSTASPAMADLTVEPPPTFAKVFAPDSIGVGQVSTLTFTIDNSASALVASSLDFTDSLPGGVEVAATPNASTTCIGGTITATAGSAVISYTGGSVGAASSCTVSVDVTATTADSFTNTSGDLTSSSGNSGNAQDDLTADPQPGFSKAFAPNPSIVGGASTLTFTIDNSSSTTAATSLDFTDNLPAGMTVASPTNAATSCTGGTLTAVSGSAVISYTGGTVGFGSSCTVTVDVTTSSDGNFANTSGSLTSSLGDSGTASDTLLVNPVPSFNKAFAPATIVQGLVSTLTFSIDNSGSTASATGLDFSDTLPAGMVVASPANAATACTGGSITAVSGAGSVSYSGGSVAAGASCTLSVDVTTPISGAQMNTSGDLTSSLGNSGSASDTLTVDLAPTPGFSKVFAPNPSIVGASSTLTFSIDNSAAAIDVTSLDFTDTLPAGMTVASPANAATSCTGGTLTAVSGSGSISYSGGTVSAGGSCTVTVDVTTSSDGSFANTSGSLTSSQGDSGTASDTLLVNPAPGFSKAFAPGTIVQGEVTTLTFTIDNSGSTVDATSLDFSDTFPASMEVASPANASTTCTGGSITAVSGSGSISYTGGTVPAGASCTLSVDVTTPISGAQMNTSGDLTSSLGNSGSASDTLTVDLAPTPGFSKVFAPNPSIVGASSTLTFSIDNSAAAIDVTSLDFTDTLPAGMTVASPANAATSCTGGTLTAVSGSGSISYSGGTVSAGGSCTVTVDVTTSSDGNFANTSGSLTSSQGDSGGASDTLLVNPAPGFSKAFAPGTIVQGEVTTLTFTIDNSGSTVDATSLDFSDTFPASMEVASPANAATTCTGGSITAVSGSGSISYSGGSVAAGASCTLSVDVTTPISGAQMNTSGDLTSSLGNSGSASDTLMVNLGPTPGFSKVFAPNPSIIGASSTLTFSIDNSAAAIDVTSLDFTDTLPAGMTVASPANAATSCTGGTLTAVAGSGSISYSGGTVSTGGSCTVTADVTTATSGNFANTSGSLTSSQGDSGGASDTLLVNPPPSLSMAFAPAAIPQGEVSTLTFTIDNSGSTVDASGLAISNSFPAGMTIASPANAATSCTGGTLTAVSGSGSISYSGGLLAAGGTCTITVDVTSATVGPVMNTSGDLTSSLGNSGTASSTLQVDPAPEPLFSKLFAPNPTTVAAGSTLTFTIDNTAAAVDATALDFLDNLPLGMRVANPANASTTCTGGTITAAPADTSISYSGGTVSAGASCTLSVDVITSVSGDYINTSSALSSSLGASTAASDTLTVVEPPTFNKLFTPDFVGPRVPSTLVFTIDNSANVLDASNLDFTDVLPQFLNLTSTPNAMTDCSGGTLTAVAGSDTISYAGGTVLAGASCTIQVEVSSNRLNTYSNVSGDLTSSLGNSGSASADLNVIQPPAIPTPTLNQWGMLLAVLLFLMIGGISLNRRSYRF